MAVEQVWPSGKTTKAGKQKDLGSIPLRLSFHFKSCGLKVVPSACLSVCLSACQSVYLSVSRAKGGLL